MDIVQAVMLRDELRMDILRLGYLFMTGAICEVCYAHHKANLHNRLVKVDNDIVLYEIQFGCVII